MGSPALVIANVLMAIAVVVGAPLAIILFTLAFAGRRRPTRPLCAACRAPLPHACMVARDACPSCGHPLAGDEAIRPLRRRPGIRSLAAAVLVTALTAGLVATAFTVAASASRQTAFGSFTPLSSLVSTALASGSRHDASLQEIGRRLRVGNVTAADLRDSLDAALASPSGRPPGVAAEVMAGWALTDGGGSEEFRRRILALAYAKPALKVEGTTAPSLVLTGPMGGAAHHDVPTVLHAVVRSATLDGQPVDGQVAGWIGHVLQPGEVLRAPVSRDVGEAVVVVELILASTFDAERHRDPEGGFRPVESWPTPLASEVLTLRARSEAPPADKGGS